MTTTTHFHYPLELDARMLPTDALFWYVEEANPELRPLIGALIMLDCCPGRERLRASIERWVARLPRLRQRVVETPLHLGLPEWEDDPQFELEYHAREASSRRRPRSGICWISPPRCLPRRSIACGRCGRRT